MPDDSGGVYTVPSGTLVNAGDTLLPSQHNPLALDMSTAMSNRFSKDGRAPATGNWNLNTFRITNLGSPVATNDAVNKAYADGLATTFADQGYLFGLTTSNNAGDAVNDIDIAPGSAAASNTTQPFKMTLASALGKRLDAAWAVGGTPGGTIGGLDTGAIADGTYHIWLIRRSDTGVVDACFSASATAPTIGGSIPVAYDQYRRIGSIIRASATIIGYQQVGDTFTRNAPVVIASAFGTLVDQLISAGTPTGIIYSPIITWRAVTAVNSVYSGVVGSAAIGSSVFQVIYTGSTSTPANRSIGVVPAGAVFTNTSGQIWIARTVTTGSITESNVFNNGWVDTRGRT